MAAIDNRLHVYYVTIPVERHESGVDNPFRPDGELSREADTIVSLIKEGKPITPVKGEDMDVVANGFQHDQTDTAAPNGHQVTEAVVTPQSNAPLQSAKPKGGANGTTPKDATATPGIVEVQRGVIVPPTDAPAVEQVIIKKKPKCKCCVIQLSLRYLAVMGENGQQGIWWEESVENKNKDYV
ncbi:uncharacterized protein CEXT_608251 [Caerostris extrusa]|uniref:Uncharacterized protein n=1 Tax=Caerostris extrusa TaxID=172846 RepID=A0AAV4TDQ8_CAEEX|nr:uncharacterized protein CEXT_608251 [Caerostris extrusa]